MKTNNSIPLSPKHGVNPSLEICFFCGEAKGIALLGKLPKDEQAPKHIILNYTPCPKCQEQWDKGVPVIAVSTTPNNINQIPITEANNKPVYPTGQWCIVKPHVFKDNKFQIGKPALMNADEYNETFGKYEQENTTNE